MPISRENALELCRTLTASTLVVGSVAAKAANPLAAVETALSAASLIAGLGQERAQQVESIIGRMATRVAKESEIWVDARGPGAAARREQALPIVQRIVPQIVPTGPEMVRLGLDRERIITFYLDRAVPLNGGAIFADTPDNAVARELFGDVIGYTFDIVRHFPELQSHAFEALLAGNQRIEAKIGNLPKAVAEQVLAGLDAKFVQDAERRGLERGTILALARRLKPQEVLDFDQAARELENAVNIALDAIARGERGSNVGDFIDAVLRRVAEQTKIGAIDQSLREIDAAMAELRLRDREHRENTIRGLVRLQESGIEQEILLRNAPGVADRIAAIADMEVDGDSVLAALRDRFAQFYDEGSQRGVNFSLEVAIAVADAALARVNGPKSLGDWRILHGVVLATLGERESGKKRLEEAVAVYHEALTENTRTRVPLDWAITQTNLGNALRALGDRESGTGRVEEAITAYREALTEYTRARVPLAWAATQNNLGCALRTLGERESGTERLEEAVAAFHEALTEYTSARTPLDWAATQINLGAALAILGERESGKERLEEAVTAYREALTECTRALEPLRWATAQNNLGCALQTLGTRESGTKRLEESVAAYREALTERTRARVPLDWAMTQNNLGNALWTLGERESGTKRLEEAVAAYREALTEYTRGRVPLGWAMTQNNLGNALWTLGERESGTERLEEAVAAYREALTEHTRERVPLDWAMTQNNLGTALQTLGTRESGTQRLEEAVAAFREAPTEWRADNAPYYHGIAVRNLARAVALLAERRATERR